MIKRLSLLAALLSAGIGPQQTSAPTMQPKLTGIAHVAIRVTDVAVSRAFFEKLGYVQPFELTDKDGKVTESFIKLSDRQWIELYPPDKNGPEFLHVCFEAVNLEDLYPIYTANGVVAPPVRKAGAGNMLMAWKGPEGQTEEITEYLPGSRHSNDFGQHLGEHRISTRLFGAIVPMRDPRGTAQWFQQKMNFTAQGMFEGAVMTEPPAIQDTYFGFLPASSSQKLILLFHVDSIKKTERQLKSLGIAATKQHDHLFIHDPDGNVFEYITSLRT